MFLMRIALFLHFNSQGNTLTDTAEAFFLGLRFDLRAVSLILLIILVFGSIPFLHPFRNRKTAVGWLILLAIITFTIAFFYVADFSHYSYLTQRLNASVLNYLDDAAISMNMVWQSYPVVWLTLGLVISTGLIFWFFKESHRRINRRFAPVTKNTRVISFVVLFLILGIAIFGRFNQYPLRWSDAFALGSDYKANLALNPFESFFNTLRFRKNSYDEKNVREFFPLLGSYLGLKASDSTSLNFRRDIPGTPTTKNVVLVLCESFSAYKSSMWGNPLNTTPFFDSISKRGLFFDYCFTPTYGTARGVWATITGIPDVESPTTASRNPSAVDQHSIINDFTSHKKFYFLGGSTSWANIRGVLTNNIAGLQLFEQEDFKAPKIDVWGISDKNLLLESNSILAKEKEPFFAVIQTADNHRPYTIPEEDLDEFKKITLPLDSVKKYGFESLAEYNAFRYTDFGFQKFMEAAAKQKYYSNTIFVFIGDHGIPGNTGEMFPKAWMNQRLTSLHVPLLFYAPGFIEPQRNNAVCSQIDVLPTIAGLCKITYSNTTLGRDILTVEQGKHFAFTFDPDNSQIGIIKDSFLFRKNIRTGGNEIVSITTNNPVPDTLGNRKGELLRLTEAMYESSKFLLLNNKKQ